MVILLYKNVLAAVGISEFKMKFGLIEGTFPNLTFFRTFMENFENIDFIFSNKKMKFFKKRKIM